GSYERSPPSAGGESKVPGDYCYRTVPGAFVYPAGWWGLLRVGKEGVDTFTCNPLYSNGKLHITGSASVVVGGAKNGSLASSVDVFYAASDTSDQPGTKIGTATVEEGGRWSIPSQTVATPPSNRVVAVSPNGGRAATSFTLIAQKQPAGTIPPRMEVSGESTRFQNTARPDAK